MPGDPAEDCRVNHQWAHSERRRRPPIPCIVPARMQICAPCRRLGMRLMAERPVTIPAQRCRVWRGGRRGADRRCLPPRLTMPRCQHGSSAGEGQMVGGRGGGCPAQTEWCPGEPALRGGGPVMLLHRGGLCGREREMGRSRRRGADDDLL